MLVIDALAIVQQILLKSIQLDADNTRTALVLLMATLGQATCMLYTLHAAEAKVRGSLDMCMCVVCGQVCV